MSQDDTRDSLDDFEELEIDNSTGAVEPVTEVRSAQVGFHYVIG